MGADPSEAIVGSSVLVVGDVMLDEHLWGSDEHLAPEAGAPTIRVERSELALGGAGNVAANAAGLGARTHLVATVGADEAGTIVRDLAAQVGVEGHFVSTATRPTTRKTRVHAHGRQIVRVDREEVGRMGTRLDAAVTAVALGLTGVVDVMLISDYAKGAVPAGVARDLVSAARGCGTPVIVDTKCADPSCYRGCTAITPHVRELERWVGRPLSGDEHVAAALELAAALDCEVVLVTDGEHGMTLVSAETSSYLPAKCDAVVSSVGAGDTVVAAFALGMSVGLAPLAAAELANAAAGVVVRQPGTSAVSRAALAS